MAHSVDVIINAKDRASRKFGIIGASAAIMGKALKGAAHTARATLATAFRVAERAALGLGAALAYSTYAAIKQQAAEVELISALKVAGEYTEENYKKLRAQADEIQDATKYGDEYVLTLMRMAMTQGVVADKAGDAAKAAIALYEGFGGGRGKPEIFMRYYIDALRGTGASLDSYVGALRNAKTEQERTKILQDALARGWDVAKSKTDSAGGALAQMKNKLGDVAETIAKPFLPAITSSAKAITQWAKENDARIAWWADKTYAWVTFAKDVFVEFAKYMKEDWRGAMGWVFDSFLEMLEAAFESAVHIAIAGGKGIWKGVKEGILGGDESKILERMEKLYKAMGGGPFPMTAGGGVLWRQGHPLYEQLRRQAEAEIQKEAVGGILGGTMAAVKNEWRKAFSDILADMPEQMSEGVDEAWAKLQKRLAELGGMPDRVPAGAGVAGTPMPFAMGAMGELLKALRHRLAPTEGRFLTFAPGTRFNRTERNTGDTAKNTLNIYKQIKQMNNNLKKIVLGGSNLAATYELSNIVG